MVPAAAALAEALSRAAAAGADPDRDRGPHLVMPERQSLRLVESIEGSELPQLPGLGHMIHYAAHHEIAEAVEEGRNRRRGDR